MINPNVPDWKKPISSSTKSTYMDFNQQKPDPNDPNEIEKTPLAPLPNSGEPTEELKEN